jgi:hypothetical protein
MRGDDGHGGATKTGLIRRARPYSGVRMVGSSESHPYLEEARKRDRVSE